MSHFKTPNIKRTKPDLFKMDHLRFFKLLRHTPGIVLKFYKGKTSITVIDHNIKPLLAESKPTMKS